MSKSKTAFQAEQKSPTKTDGVKAIKTSMQPYHFNADFLSSVQEYNRKNTEFVTKRITENLSSASALLTTTSPSEIFRESAHWWQTMAHDYMSHIADGLDFSQEVKQEIDDLVETETAISKAKPQEMFDNSPV